MLPSRCLCASFAGYCPQSSAVLVQLQVLANSEQHLEAIQIELEQLKREVKQVNQVARSMSLLSFVRVRTEVG